MTGLLGDLGELRGREMVTSKSILSIAINAKMSFSSGSFAIALFVVGCGLYIPCWVFATVPLVPPLHPKPGGNWSSFPSPGQ